MTEQDRIKGPNRKPEAETDAQRAALLTTCMYLGKTFYENDTICYRREQWVCHAGAWEKTGNACGG